MNELERVALTVDLPEHGLMTGDVGMIVHVYAEAKGYEVEFVTVNGALVALLPLYPAQVRRLEQDEISHVRRVQPT